MLANGQAFRLSGTGAVRFLAAATQGMAAGTGSLVYADGTTEPCRTGSIRRLRVATQRSA